MPEADFKTTQDGMKHIPVLYREVLEYLVPSGALRIVDATVGSGGHSSLILRKNQQAALLGIDQDGEALTRAGEVLEFAAARIHLVRGRFSQLASLATELGWDSVDVVLLDIGVSSPQIDDQRRGFSFRLDGPLDMRMDLDSPVAAGWILNNAPLEELQRIFREYGEIISSRKLAEAIIRRRTERPFESTLDFANCCEDTLGRSRHGRLPIPTLCFQALRIAVNDELGELGLALPAALKLLAPGGRMGVITFHSLEDRMVKNFFREAARECTCPPGLPVCLCQHQPEVRILTKKPVTAQEDELRRNPRSASAKLRVIEKI
jgi:16S rRNA (cytosine1402-N4)-methyltransferase